MKNKLSFNQLLPENFNDGVEIITAFGRRNSVPLGLFLLMCLNLFIAPAVLAANENLDRTAAWAIGLLGIVTLGLSVYLFFVIFQPERF